MALTIPAMFDAAAASYSGEAFLIWEESVTTYGEFQERTNRIAAGLKDLLSGRRGHVATLMESGPELLTIEVAAARCGCPVVPIPPESTDTDVAYYLQHSQSTAVFVDSANEARLADVDCCPDLVIRVDGDGPTSFPDAPTVEDLWADRAGRPLMDDASPEDTWAIIYTSGTTAKPKGVMLSHASFTAAGELKARRLRMEHAEGAMFCVLPLYHAGGLYFGVSPAVARGNAVALQRHFSASTFWDFCTRTNARVGTLVPMMMAALKNQPPRKAETAHAVRAVACYGYDAEFATRFGVHGQVEIWGQTETGGGLAVYGSLDGPHEPNLIGWPLSDDIELKVVDDLGRTLPEGEVGEICVRHPWVMNGYWRDEELTSHVLKEGWVHTGDLGRLDESTALYFAGRKKNMIKRAGKNIAAAEVEEALRSHPKVAEVACFGVPDPIYTEEVKVVVVPCAGILLTAPEVAQWCQPLLAAYKVPRFIEITTDVPRAQLGKINTTLLQAQHEQRPGWDRTHRNQAT
jgi:crotonobetaine/carnitine-CoA ligase